MSDGEDEESRQELRQAFAEFAGEERYRRFVAALEGWGPEEGRLYYWQERLLEKFTAQTGLDLCAGFDALKAFFAGAFPRYELAENDLPDWCQIEYLEGFCPVQGGGTCDGFAWYFRARWDGWSLAVATDPALDPVDIHDAGQGFYREELYGDARYDAGYMPLDEARHFIARSLEEFRAERRTTT